MHVRTVASSSRAAAGKNARDYVQMPWIQRLRCELVSRPTGSDGKERRIKASYIGPCTEQTRSRNLRAFNVDECGTGELVLSV
eukprot:SAG11_NODE_4678_length_1809_cov_1.433918_3_plen_83_part_00